MRLRSIGIVLIAVCLALPVALRATPPASPGSCPSDTKLLNGGPTAVFGQGPGTFWGLVLNGLTSAGLVTQADQVAYLNGVFGTSFGTLTELEIYNTQLVSSAWDENGNGYICAFELRGRRAYLGDPLVNLTYFGISDDRIARH